MSDFIELRGDQARQIVDTEQVFTAYRATDDEISRRFSGAMSWKRVRGRDYLYRKRGSAWKALGVRSPEAEKTHDHFHEGRKGAKDRLAGLVARLNEMAPVNRAMGLGRMPVIAARILRALGKAKLLGGAVDLVGTHALYGYERMAGVFVAGGHLATDDVDLLYDARARLHLLGSEIAASGLAGLLQKIDRSFSLTGESSFRAVNRDGFMVDLIQPMPVNRMGPAGRSRIGTAEDDLTAVEIEGLSWLVNSPKVETTAIDARGYPVRLVSPDPRAFALHKLWLAKQPDRDPLKRRRDAAQGELVVALVQSRLAHLRFDDPVLGALPKGLRAQVPAPLREQGSHDGLDQTTEPDWY